MTSANGGYLRKFYCLINKTYDCNELNREPSVDKSRWVMNISGKELSEHENGLLSRKV